eukprot:20962_1
MEFHEQQLDDKEYQDIYCAHRFFQKDANDVQNMENMFFHSGGGPDTLTYKQLASFGATHLSKKQDYNSVFLMFHLYQLLNDLRKKIDDNFEELNIFVLGAATHWFSDTITEFINIINDNNLLIEDCNNECRIDTYIFGRGDEMWIGIIDKSIYGPYVSVECKYQSLFYYHGGQIHGFSKTYGRMYRKLDEKHRYDKYDWISFTVDKNRKKLIFYKNKCKVIEIDKLPEGNHLVYTVVVDEQDDGFFVEKIMFNDC